MLIFFCLALSMLACVTSKPDFREILEEKERLDEILQMSKNKLFNFCKDPQALCNCTIGQDSFAFSCFNEDSGEDIVIKLSDFVDDTVVFTCVHVPSFMQVPDLTYYIDSLKVFLKNCTVPENETISQLSSKISEKSYYIHLTYQQDNITSITNDIFDKLVNNLPLLNDLQDLQTNSDNSKNQNMIDKIQENVTTLELNCHAYCPIDPLIFASLINLAALKMKGDFIFITTENVFTNNERLTRIELKQMQNFQIPRKLFAQMMNLRTVIITNVDLETLPEDLFYESSNIVEIQLTKNKLKSLPKDIFVDQVNLFELNLRKNHMEELVDGLFDTTINMRILNLSHNKLISISRYLFAKLEKLETLLIINNVLKSVGDSFKNLMNLQVVNLRYNQLLDYELNNCFDLLKRLKKVYLGHNNLRDFSISNQTDFRNLQVLDLSHNNISKFNYVNFSTTTLRENCLIDLSFNNITEFKVEELLNFALRADEKILNAPIIILKLDENPIDCDCNALELVQFINKKTESYDIHNIFELDAKKIRCQKPYHLYDRLLRNLSSTELICNIEKDCPEGCECKQRSVDNTLILECKSFNQKLPPLPNFEDLNLTIVELYAANNQIDSICLINIPDSLKLLDLRNNSLMTLSNIVLKRFETIDELYLSGNLWTCECSSVDLVHFFHQFRSKILDADHMICADGRPFKVLEAKDFCVQLIEGFVLFLIGTSVLGLLSLLSVIFKKQIKIWLYANNCCLWWVSEEEADKDMVYDAFFVFSHFDDSFVTDTIIKLEEKSFKCCVHHRDWMAGEMIVTQALNSIKTSRRIIVVLSPTFVESNWATWEFRVSLIHAFNQKRSRVLVIIHGNVSLIDALDEDLKKYIAYNTYLDSGDKWFDEKLLYAMPHKTVPDINDNRELTATRSELVNCSIEHIYDENDTSLDRV